MCAQKEQKTEKKAGNFVKGNVAQILGIRGGDKESNIWKIRLQLTKPVTWIPLIWGTSATTLCVESMLFCTTQLHVQPACSEQLSK